MTFILKFFAVMFLMILADICWTMYFIEVEKRKPVSAGLWGAAILLFGSVVTIGYVQDIRLLAAAVVGSFIGVAGTVWYKKKMEQKSAD